MNDNGNDDITTMTISSLSHIPVKLWRVNSVKVPHPNIKAYQPILQKRGLRRLFKTKTSANNYALAVRMRYISLLDHLDYV
jgi:hypothetical protein